MKKILIILAIIFLVLIVGAIIIFYVNFSKDESNILEDMVVDKIVYPSDSASIQLELNLFNDKIVLLNIKKSVYYPNYLPGRYPFIAKLYSMDSKLLAEYGFNDPRIIQGEMGYAGPTWQDNKNFTLTLPLIENTKEIRIYSNSSILLSIDVNNLN